MKTILIGLIALVFVLGTGCKKNETVEKTKALSSAAHQIIAGVEVRMFDGTGTYDPTIYPHVTGLCSCSGCKNYYWAYSTVPLHRNPCICPKPIQQGDGSYQIPPPMYNNETQIGCNNPTLPGSDVPIPPDTLDYPIPQNP